MNNDMKDMLQKVIAGGIGAVSTMAEKGEEVAKILIEKGEKTLRENQETIDDVKKTIRDAVDEAKNSGRKAVLDAIDVHSLTREERSELRRRLDEADAEDDAAEENVPEVVVEEIEENDTLDETERKIEDFMQRVDAAFHINRDDQK